MNKGRARDAWATAGCIASIAVAAAFFLPGAARAKQATEYEHSFSQVWSAAVRLLRVDLGHAIVEKDDETGFVIFEYRDGKKAEQGSLELIAAKGNRTRVVVHVSRMPSYVERLILDKLRRKLRGDYGEPEEKPPADPDASGSDDPDAGGS